jgi:hypothetical protein
VSPDDQISRFEVVANYLCHTDQRRLDFQVMASDSGYADHLLRGTIRRIAEPLGLIEKSLDREGSWFSLKVDPFSAPPEEEEKEVETDAPQEESSMERLYRECCDEANTSIRGTILGLDGLRGKVEPAVGSLLMDACVELSQISILLTRISATGVKPDRSDYISDLRTKVQEILRNRL